MTKKDFVAIAARIVEANRTPNHVYFSRAHTDVLGKTFAQINPRFDWDKWNEYIWGKPNTEGSK